MNIKIIKIGGALLNDSACRQKILALFKKYIALNNKLVVVLSAMGRGTDPYSTDGLDSRVQGPLTYYERDRLRSIGETFSVLYMAGFLRENGLDVSTCSYKELGITSFGSSNWSFDKRHVIKKVSDSDICLVPGYIVSNKLGEPETLPREGSDLSACIIAKGLGIDTIFLMKDIEGVYNSDQKLFHNLTSDEFLNLISNFTSPISEAAIKYSKNEKIDLIVINTSDVEVARVTS